MEKSKESLKHPHEDEHAEIHQDPEKNLAFQNNTYYFLMSLSVYLVLKDQQQEQQQRESS